MINTISIKGNSSFQLNNPTGLELKKAFIQRYPSFLLDNIHIYDRQVISNNTDILEENTLYTIIILSIICHH
jgi:hypothetical protein